MTSTAVIVAIAIAVLNVSLYNVKSATGLLSESAPASSTPTRRSGDLDMDEVAAALWKIGLTQKKVERFFKETNAA